MFSHVMVGVNNLEKSKKFYDAIFGTIGIGPGVANKERYFYMSPGGVFAITKPINGKPVRDQLVFQYLLPTSLLFPIDGDAKHPRFLPQLDPTGDEHWDALIGARFT